jgi:hypothetical protein
MILIRRVPVSAWIALLAIGVYAAALGYVMAPMMGAQFSHVDDHEIAVMIGPSQHIALADVPGKIAQFAMENDGRFRPGYYFLRVVEAAFAGTHTHIWYLDRFVLALIAGGAIVTLAYGYVTRITMVVLPLMLIAGPQSEMWTMLGPQETYAVPMVLVGLALVRWRHQTSGLALLLAAGLVKESFVLLVPAILVWLAWRQGRAAWRTIAIAGAIVGLEAAGVAIEVLRFGDFYGQTRSVGSAIATAWQMLGQFSTASGWYLAGLLGLCAAAYVKGGPMARTAALLSGGAFALVFLPQAYFYGGDPAAVAGRYLLPALFFAILVAALGYWVAEGVDRSRAMIGASVVVALTSMLLMVPQLRTSKGTAAAFAADTQSFQAGIHQVEDLVQSDPSTWVVLRPSQLLAYYEADFAVEEFLENGVEALTRIAIEAPPLAAGATPLEVRLNATIQTLSTEGGRGFQILPDKLAADRCVEVDFGQARADARCTRVVVITGI